VAGPSGILFCLLSYEDTLASCAKRRNADIGTWNIGSDQRRHRNTTVTFRILPCYVVNMLRRFNKIFDIHDELPTEQGRFVQRINQTAFDHIEKLTYAVSYQGVFSAVCYLLGTNANDRISKANRMSYSSTTFVPPLRSLTEDEFMETIKVLSFLHKTLEKAPGEQETLSRYIEAALRNATIDLGVEWKGGMFYPSGARELDESLIEEPLGWLVDFPNERADYLKALTGYTSKRLDEVIINCYLAVEGIARQILGNSRTLDNNREDLIKKIGLSQEWKGLLSNFINYANEFKRHASEKRHDLNPVEVEGFLYMSGVILRMAILATSGSTS
jgi:hypothetical protein